MTPDWRRAAADLCDGLLRRTHLSRPADIGTLVLEEARGVLGATDVVLYWVDREQTDLVAISVAGEVSPAPLSVDGTVAGRAFAKLSRHRRRPGRCSSARAGAGGRRH